MARRELSGRGEAPGKTTAGAWNGGRRCGRAAGDSWDVDGEDAWREKEKASIRAKAEHPFFYVKRMFGYDKVRYRGLHKNKQRIALLLGFANLLIAERSLASLPRYPCAWTAAKSSRPAWKRPGFAAPLAVGT